ncbi:cytochrome P450 CYP82D47-like isoform X2 [Telopea speciosissima]|uniref:cytochrome P450 CYP82D47-like isoform X2 n=1 Tax=Telopea speciosissima TaxID=54955 RepID=UPI001CC4856D|nr:cytochrome P450 CYP82D47-like isoform X2 [Telopea speciosissima]
MDSLLQFPTVVVLLFSFLVLLYYLLPWRSRNTTKLISPSNKRVSPPEAAGAWPIIGHLHLLDGNPIPHITLGALADKYGPAFTIRLGMQPTLVVSSWEVAKECFSTNDRALATRSKAIATKLMGYNYALFGFARYGTYWREVRKIVMLELRSNRRLEMVKHVRASEIEAFIKEIYKNWEAAAAEKQQGRVLVDMKKWFADLTLNIIVRMVAGKRYFGKADAEEAKRCQEGVREFFHYIGLFVVSDAFPFLEGLDLHGYEKAMKKTAKNLDSIVDGWLKEHKKKRSSDEYAKAKGSSDHQDFMDVMISIMEDSKISSTDYDAETVIKATCLNMILGANDATVVTFTWVLSLLLNNPHVLKKAQDELDMHIGKERQVDESDIVKLEYLQALVKETLRLYPPTLLSASHEAIEECTISGFHIQVGTRILTNLYKIHRDPRVWLEPSEFRPERFLTSHADIDLRGQHFEFIPFGSGRRMCPGISFALQVLHLGLARLLHGFEFATPSNAPVDMTESQGLTNLKATPLQVLLSPRLPSEAYG